MRSNIEAERGRMNLTKSEICEKLGITAKTYNSYLSGKPIPSTVLEKLREMSGMSVDYLLGLPTTEHNENRDCTALSCKEGPCQ